ncbi:phosphate transporter PHO1 homolog 10-like [Humulus lupulus]|uniref:phosphate transporter PHO1 homolog 10-like n=1 Tax=Humulus lupulus TaxID=3486 RepID=UPI002B413311|nr:phosphate transporter PHO1 homolog 10-like [Humulus lupulus]
MDETNQLNKQMESLISLRIRVGKHNFEGSNSDRHYQQEQSQNSGNKEKVKVDDQNQDPAEITSRKASKFHMEVVDNSGLGNSDEYRFFSGCTVAVLVAIALRIELHDLMTKEGGVQYLQSIFPLYSVFLYAVLHLLVYAANIYFWRRYRINYPFIFGFKRGAELEYRDVFLLTTRLAVLASSGFLANSHMYMDPSTKILKEVTQLVPLGCHCKILVLLIICPLNILYRASHFFFVRCLFRCILTSLYPISMNDFLVAKNICKQHPLSEFMTTHDSD